MSDSLCLLLCNRLVTYLLVLKVVALWRRHLVVARCSVFPGHQDRCSRGATCMGYVPLPILAGLLLLPASWWSGMAINPTVYNDWPWLLWTCWWARVVPRVLSVRWAACKAFITHQSQATQWLLFLCYQPQLHSSLSSLPLPLLFPVSLKDFAFFSKWTVLLQTPPISYPFNQTFIEQLPCIIQK